MRGRGSAGDEGEGAPAMRGQGSAGAARAHHDCNHSPMGRSAISARTSGARDSKGWKLMSGRASDSDISRTCGHETFCMQRLRCWSARKHPSSDLRGTKDYVVATPLKPGHRKKRHARASCLVEAPQGEAEVRGPLHVESVGYRARESAAEADPVVIKLLLVLQREGLHGGAARLVRTRQNGQYRAVVRGGGARSLACVRNGDGGSCLHQSQDKPPHPPG